MATDETDETTEASASSETQPPRMSAEEVRQFVLDVLSNRIMLSVGLSPQELQMVFFPLLFGALSKMSREYIEQIGVIYEYLSEAAPRSCNGLPSFFSMHIMHKDDWAIASATLQREFDRMQTMTLEQPLEQPADGDAPEDGEP